MPMLSIRDKLGSQNTKLAEQKAPILNHPIAPGTDPEGSFFYIELSAIVVDPNQPRKFFEPVSLAELSESIKQKGVLQPVLIRKDTDGQICLVVGERRYRAARMAGLERIPAILTKGNPHELALIENLQRENLVPMEEAEALERLAVDHQYTHETLSQAIGKARSTVTEILSLNRLPESIKTECRSSREVPRRLLVEIAKAQTEEEMIQLFEKARQERFNSDRLRSLRKGQSDKGKESPALILTKKSRAITQSLNKLDMIAVDDNERESLVEVLAELKETLDRILDNVGAPTISNKRENPD